MRHHQHAGRRVPGKANNDQVDQDHQRRTIRSHAQLCQGERLSEADGTVQHVQIFAMKRSVSKEDGQFLRVFTRRNSGRSSEASRGPAECQAGRRPRHFKVPGRATEHQGRVRDRRAQRTMPTEDSGPKPQDGTGFPSPAAPRRDRAPPLSLEDRRDQQTADSPVRGAAGPTGRPGSELPLAASRGWYPFRVAGPRAEGEEECRSAQRHGCASTCETGTK